MIHVILLLLLLLALPAPPPLRLWCRVPHQQVHQR